MKNTPYKKELPIDELQERKVPDNERYEIIKYRLFYSKTKNSWKRIGQGRYNWLASNGYAVSYVDNACLAEEGDL